MKSALIFIVSFVGIFQSIQAGGFSDDWPILSIFGLINFNFFLNFKNLLQVQLRLF